MNKAGGGGRMLGHERERQGPSPRDKHNGQHSGKGWSEPWEGGGKEQAGWPSSLTPGWPVHCSRPTTRVCRGLLGDVHWGLQEGRERDPRDSYIPDPQNPHHSSNYELFPLGTKVAPHEGRQTSTPN